MFQRNTSAFIASVILLASLHSAHADHAVPGTVFHDPINDQDFGPEMVTLPAGKFLMGTHPTEVGRFADEGPQHEVRIARPFALGRKEITVAEFARFVTATGYLTDAETTGGSWLRHTDPAINDWLLAPDMNWRHDHLGNPAPADFPVVHISWNDAQSYIQWLSRTTGQHYRLPTEAEFEYANRAGSQTPFWWGSGAPATPVANIRGANEQGITPPQLWNITELERRHAASEGPTWYAFPGYSDGFGGLAPVGSLQANPFGLFDTSGNVWEWTQDCYRDSYQNAPTDGKAVMDKQCEKRVLRGASFYCLPRFVRTANRWSRPAEARGMYIGFRVARDL